jgi:hypothetical protein
LPAARNASTWAVASGVRCIWRKSAPIVSMFLLVLYGAGFGQLTRPSWEILADFQGHADAVIEIQRRNGWQMRLSDAGMRRRKSKADYRDHLCDPEEKSLSAEARARASPSSVKTTDLFLFFGSSMKPRAYNRFDASQSIPFHARVRPCSSHAVR